MKISKAFETPLGAVQFEGELTQKEFDYVLEVGLTALMLRGAISMQSVESDTEETSEGQTLQ